MNKLIDIIAKLIAGMALLALCSLAALVIFFKVTDTPKEFRNTARDDLVREMLKEDKVPQWSDLPGYGYVAREPRTTPRERWTDDVDDGRPVIDILPDGGGLEGELDSKQLSRVIDSKTNRGRASRDGK